MLIIYRILFIIIIILGAPFFLLKALAGRHGIKERMGLIEKRKSTGRLFWFHAASVGELKILALILPKIKKEFGDIEFAVSTTTITGRSMAGKIFGDSVLIFLQPIEIKSAIKRTINRIKPERLIMVETELWPLMLTTAIEEGLKTFLINGRMSRKSFRLYKMARPLFSPALSGFERLVVQTAEDAKRFKKLGAKNISVVGNVKYDQALGEKDISIPQVEFENPGKIKFVAGSIRKSEDDIFIKAIARSFDKKLPCRFIFVPRHMKDVDGICDRLTVASIRYFLWSDYEEQTIDDKTVLIVNTMGELPGFYSIADIAFVGGSLVPIGGHDPVEPASLGKAVIFGPYMENAFEAATALLSSGGAKEVKNSDEILDFIQTVGENREVLKVKGERCRDAIKSLTGASDRTVELIMREDN
jgi:3-deoxy-D-manno-octulosonic-acid transferase